MGNSARRQDQDGLQKWGLSPRVQVWIGSRVLWEEKVGGERKRFIYWIFIGFVFWNLMIVSSNHKNGQVYVNGFWTCLALGLLSGFFLAFFFGGVSLMGSRTKHNVLSCSMLFCVKSISWWENPFLTSKRYGRACYGKLFCRDVCWVFLLFNFH